MFPRFITMTRSAVRMVWTRCCKQTTTPIRFCGQNLEEIMATEISKKRHAVVWFDTNQAVSGSKGFSRPRISQEEKETQQKQVGKKWKEEKRQKIQKWSVLVRVYLWVLTSTLKRLSSCDRRLGPESLSTRIPEEKTNTCSASKIEDTRCWWRDGEDRKHRGEKKGERAQKRRKKVDKDVREEDERTRHHHRERRRSSMETVSVKRSNVKEEDVRSILKVNKTWWRHMRLKDNEPHTCIHHTWRLSELQDRHWGNLLRS